MLWFLSWYLCILFFEIVIELVELFINQLAFIVKYALIVDLCACAVMVVRCCGGSQCRLGVDAGSESGTKSFFCGKNVLCSKLFLVLLTSYGDGSSTRGCRLYACRDSERVRLKLLFYCVRTI